MELIYMLIMPWRFDAPKSVIHGIWTFGPGQ